MARIDYLTQLDFQQEYFSDFLSSFDKSPLSNDLARLRNENSVKQSVRNLVLTNLGERPFQPDVGGNVSHMLFEPFTNFTADDLKKDILNTLKQNEPRISASDLTVQVIPNADQNEFTVNIFFYIINQSEPTSVSLILQRVR
jgi:hypothetical protein